MQFNQNDEMCRYTSTERDLCFFHKTSPMVNSYRAAVQWFATKKTGQLWINTDIFSNIGVYLSRMLLNVKTHLFHCSPGMIQVFSIQFLQSFSCAFSTTRLL